MRREYFQDINTLFKHRRVSIASQTSINEFQDKRMLWIQEIAKYIFSKCWVTAQIAYCLLKFGEL